MQEGSYENQDAVLHFVYRAAFARRSAAFRLCLCDERRRRQVVCGGIAGIINDNGAGIAYIRACENHGAVYGEGVKVGGILGYLSQAASGGGAEVSGCANYGGVTFATGTQSRTGGVVGYANSASTTAEKIPNIACCVNYGDLVTAVGYESGGVIGFNAGANMTNCVNLGSVTTMDAGSSGAKAAGGVIGKTYTATDLAFTISDCYTATGEVIPDTGYEKPTQFVFTDCAVSSESDMLRGSTTLTFGEDGYTVRAGRLTLSALVSILKKGDINADGKLSLADVLTALRRMLDKTESVDNGVVDLDGNGVITLLDVLRLLKIIAD